MVLYGGRGTNSSWCGSRLWSFLRGRGRSRSRRGSRGFIVGWYFNRRIAFVDALKVDFRGNTTFPCDPFLGSNGILITNTRRVDVGLEGLSTSRNGERDGFNICVIDGLISPHHLIFMDLGVM